MIDKLNLMSRELVTVIRDGERTIPPEKLVLGDLMYLRVSSLVMLRYVPIAKPMKAML